MNNFLSFSWSSVDAPHAATSLEPAQATVKETRAVYQELFSRLVTLQFHLERKEYDLFKMHWSELKKYDEVWTRDMERHLDPHFDGQFFAVWFHPECTFPIEFLQKKIEGCLSVIDKLA